MPTDSAPKGWKIQKLADIFTLSAGGDVNKSLFSESQDLIHRYPIFANALTNKGLYGYSSDYKVEQESITITGRGDIGKVFYRTGKYTPIVRLVVGIPKDNISAKYMSYACSRIRFFNETTGVPQLTVPQVASYKVLTPPLEEQEKIAQILATWDSAIEQLTDLIAEKQHQKKALMQRLLTGKQRLPGFNKPWKKQLLNDLFKIYKGRDLSKNLVSISGKHKCILYGEIYTKYSEVIREVVSKTDANLGVPSISGDILVPASTTTQGIDLAKASVVLEDNVLLGGDINILRKKSELSSEFFSYALTNVYNFNIAKLTQGITIVHLYPEHLKGLVLYVPELSEQKAIADVLMAADAEIDLLQQQLQAITEQKQGLMQQLLTGKIRVKEDCNV